MGVFFYVLRIEILFMNSSSCWGKMEKKKIMSGSKTRRPIKRNKNVVFLNIWILYQCHACWWSDTVVWQFYIHSNAKYFSAQLCSQTFVHMNNLLTNKASVQRSAHLFLAIVIHIWLFIIQSHMNTNTFWKCYCSRNAT